MYAAQCVERQLVILAPMLLGIHPTATTRAELDALWDRMFSQPMGRTLRELERNGLLLMGFQDRLERALRLRNRLAHNYFWERAGEFMEETGRAEMRTELSEAAEFLHSLDDELVQMTRVWRRSIGVSDVMIAEELRRLIRYPPAV